MSRPEYERRMQRVVEHIDRHLDQSHELADLAAVAHFSPFHFHRLFAAWMGETLGDYVRRRRLEVAALRLASQPALSVTEVALSVGFGSPEAFARAFKGRFGCTASAWRVAEKSRRERERASGGYRNPDQAERNPGQAAPAPAQHHGPPNVPEPAPMKVTLIDRPDVRIAYVRYVGPPGEAVGRFWHETYYPWAVQHGFLGEARIGLSHDDPAITGVDRFRYDAGVELPPGFIAPPDMLTTVVPGGRYAARRFFGGGHDIAEAWSGLLRDWLPASGFALDARPFFEHYPRDARYDPDTGEFECDLCIPVVPLR